MKLIRKRAFTDSSVIKNPLCSAGDAGSVPGQGTKIPYAVEQLSPRATTTEPACSRESTFCSN